MSGQEAVEKVQKSLEQHSQGRRGRLMIRQNSLQEEWIYGLILMDCQMPKMDGYKATDFIRALHEQHSVDQPVIIACTGHTENQFIEKAWRHEMDEFMGKPIDAEVL
jgi:CheY-like chemotaxis protein